ELVQAVLVVQLRAHELLLRHEEHTVALSVEFLGATLNVELLGDVHGDTDAALAHARAQRDHFLEGALDDEKILARDTADDTRAATTFEREGNGSDLGVLRNGDRLAVGPAVRNDGGIDVVSVAALDMRVDGGQLEDRHIVGTSAVNMA